ncbi:MAG: DNA primase [Gammaproteobacteria bacterium]|nr:MAG: DNA primase [Gammaproteobacteria bacterium]
MAGRIPQHFIDELIARTDIVEVIGQRVPLKKKGREYAACCPFHSEKTPSFYVSPAKQFYHCFGCGAHGTAIGFLMEYDNLEFVEAVEELARMAGVEVPREQASDRGGAARSAPEHDLQPLRDLMQAAASFYQEQLRHSPQAVEYLRQRGLSGEIARDYGLGHAPDDWDALLQHLQAPEEQLVQAGLAIRNERGRVYDRFRNRIMFPIRNRRGQVIGFGGRVLGDGEPKYLNSPETPLFHKGRELYGLYEARQFNRRLDRLLVVEGYMDVIALAQHGIRNAVATLGTATTPEHLQVLFRTVSQLVFCFDGDRAGREAAWKALAVTLPFMQDGFEVGFLFLPEGEDPDSLVRAEGQAAFERRLDQATGISEYLIAELTRRHNVHTQAGRTHLATDAMALIGPMPRGLLRTALVEEVARLTHLRPEQLEGGQGTRIAAVDRRQQLRITPVRLALHALLHEPALADDDMPTDWLHTLDRPGIDLLLELIETIRREPHISPAVLLERYRGTEAGRHLQRIAAWQPPGFEGAAVARMYQDAMDTLRRQHEEQRLEALLHKADTEGLSEAEKRELRGLLERR